MPNLTLAICELYIPYFHGYTENSSKNIYKLLISFTFIFYPNNYVYSLQLLATS